MIETTPEIFHTQQVFRTLLDCLARPGKIGTIESMYTSPNQNLNDYLVSVLMTLLDQEVSFHVHGGQADQVSFLKVLTMAKADTVENCNYLIINGQDQADFSLLKKGTLNFPDQSATVICQVERISADKDSADTQDIYLTLQGPGIKTENQCYIQGLLEDNLREWQLCNLDFPLGIDLILVDQEGHICCLPRSVRMNWEVL